MEQIKFDESKTESFSQQLIQLLSTLKRKSENTWICISDQKQLDMYQ